MLILLMPSIIMVCPIRIMCEVIVIIHVVMVGLAISLGKMWTVIAVSSLKGRVVLRVQVVHMVVLVLGVVLLIGHVHVVVLGELRVELVVVVEAVVQGLRGFHFGAFEEIIK